MNRPTLTLEEARKALAARYRGRKAQATGAAWEDTVMRMASARGWMVYHQRPGRTAAGWRSSISGTPGFPDTVLAHPAGDVVVIELKAGKSPVLLHQKAWHEALRRGGVEVHVWRPEMLAEIRARLDRHVPESRRSA